MIVFYFFMPFARSRRRRRMRASSVSRSRRRQSGHHGVAAGKVLEIDEKTVLLEVDSNVKLRFEKSAIAMDNSMQLNEATTKS